MPDLPIGTYELKVYISDSEHITSSKTNFIISDEPLSLLEKIFNILRVGISENKYLMFGSFNIILITLLIFFFLRHKSRKVN